MIPSLFSRMFIVLVGTLYPAYASYKTIKTRNVRNYVHWMMYWVVFAVYTTIESVTDIFLHWLPMYYELKIVFILWLLTPITRGSSLLYRRFLHPKLAENEVQIERLFETYQQNCITWICGTGARFFKIFLDTVFSYMNTLNGNRNTPMILQESFAPQSPQTQSESDGRFDAEDTSDNFHDIDDTKDCFNVVHKPPRANRKAGRPKAPIRVGTRKSSRNLRSSKQIKTEEFTSDEE